jgi:hypothetical protein
MAIRAPNRVFPQPAKDPKKAPLLRSISSAGVPARDSAMYRHGGGQSTPRSLPSHRISNDDQPEIDEEASAACAAPSKDLELKPGKKSRVADQRISIQPETDSRPEVPDEYVS